MDNALVRILARTNLAVASLYISCFLSPGLYGTLFARKSHAIQQSQFTPAIAPAVATRFPRLCPNGAWTMVIVPPDRSICATIDSSTTVLMQSRRTSTSSSWNTLVAKHAPKYKILYQISLKLCCRVGYCRSMQCTDLGNLRIKIQIMFLLLWS